MVTGLDRTQWYCWGWSYFIWGLALLLSILSPLSWRLLGWILVTPWTVILGVQVQERLGWAILLLVFLVLEQVLHCALWHLLRMIPCSFDTERLGSNIWDHLQQLFCLVEHVNWMLTECPFHHKNNHSRTLSLLVLWCDRMTLFLNIHQSISYLKH